MNAWFNFLNWPLRAKLAVLLLTASLLPLAIAAIIDIHRAQEHIWESTPAGAGKQSVKVRAGIL